MALRKEGSYRGLPKSLLYSRIIGLEVRVGASSEVKLAMYANQKSRNNGTLPLEVIPIRINDDILADAPVPGDVTRVFWSDPGGLRLHKRFDPALDQADEVVAIDPQVFDQIRTSLYNALKEMPRFNDMEDA